MNEAQRARRNRRRRLKTAAERVRLQLIYDPDNEALQRKLFDIERELLEPPK
jgi:hypothetical protein